MRSSAITLWKPLYHGIATALISFLIEQKKHDQAFAWVNLFSTADLADYNRLINAKVANPEAQKAIEKWNQNSSCGMGF